MQRYDKLEVKLKDGQTIHWSADRWDDYDLDERTFTVIKSRAPAAIYDLSCVEHIRLEDTKDGTIFMTYVGEYGTMCSSMSVGDRRGTMGIGQPTIGIGPSSIAMGQSSTAIGPETIAAGRGPIHAVGGFAPGESYRHIEGTPLDPERFHGHAVWWAPDWHYQHMEGTSVDSKSCHGRAEGLAIGTSRVAMT